MSLGPLATTQILAQGSSLLGREGSGQRVQSRGGVSLPPAVDPLLGWVGTLAPRSRGHWPCWGGSSASPHPLSAPQRLACGRLSGWQRRGCFRSHTLRTVADGLLWAVVSSLVNERVVLETDHLPRSW